MKTNKITNKIEVLDIYYPLNEDIQTPGEICDFIREIEDKLNELIKVVNDHIEKCGEREANK